MKKQYYWILGALLGIVVIWSLRPSPLPVDVVSIEQGNFEKAIVEEGMTRIENRFVVSSPVDGVLPRVEWKPGQQVKKRQKLLTIQWDQPRPIYSPADGEILRVHSRDKGFITKGKPILEIGSIGDLEIVVDVLTANAIDIQVKDEVRIENWGGDSPLKGEVKSIEPSGFTKVSALGVEEQRVNIIIVITSPKEIWQSLGDRFRVECHIITDRKKDVLLVPTGAIFQLEGQWHVFKYVSGKALKTAIEIADKGPLQSILVSGLAPGDRVINYPGDRVKDNVRVSE